MLKYLVGLLSLVSVKSYPMNEVAILYGNARNVNLSNGCISFTVSSGTGCAWMCNYCANNLGTDNYYFQPAICTYQSGVGCVGNPQAGVTYQCCSA
jgi:hypothetical protein